MRYSLLALTMMAALGQEGRRSQSAVYTIGANGQRELSTQSTAGPGGGQTQIRNLNGGFSPLETVEERVVSDDANGKVVERIVRGYDAQGNPAPPQKIVTTEKKQADGSLSVDKQVFQGTISGGFALSERVAAVTRTTGDTTTTETQIARPTVNGSFDTVEKQSATVTKKGTATVEDTLTYRRDNNGSFYGASREVKQTDVQGAKTVENVATYIAGDQRQLQLSGQTVAETVKAADGSESRQVNIYGMNAPGRPAGGQPVLREQQIIEKQKTSQGTVESLSIRRPALDDPRALGPVTKVSETVCTGTCQ